jgi:hypothetical protein
VKQASESRSIAVIYSTEDSGGEALSRAMLDVATEVRDTLAAMGHRASLFSVDEGVGPFAERLEALQPDAVFNLCEDITNGPGESCVAGLLDLLGIPTGSALAL